MRIVFFGSPTVAVGPLEALVDAGHDVVMVVTGPDRRRGRGSTTTPTPVKAAAGRLGLRVVEDMCEILDIEAHLGVVVAYGRLIPTEILERMPFVNIHFSLLPRWRGAAPVERAVLAGDTVTGVSVMEVVEELDAGGVYASETVPIDDEDTSADLTERLGAIGTRLLVELLDDALPTPAPQQSDGVTYAHKITNADRELSPDLGVDDFLRRIRIGSAWTTIGGRRLKVHRASRRPVAASSAVDQHTDDRTDPGSLVDGPGVVLHDGVVDLITVQPAGRAEMSASDWVRGADVIGRSIGT